MCSGWGCLLAPSSSCSDSGCGLAGSPPLGFCPHSQNVAGNFLQGHKRSKLTTHHTSGDHKPMKYMLDLVKEQVITRQSGRVGFRLFVRNLKPQISWYQVILTSFSSMEAEVSKDFHYNRKSSTEECVVRQEALKTSKYCLL